MQPLRHGYTNDTRGDGRVVVKRYTGPHAPARRSRERAMLTGLQGLLPVPALLDGAEGDKLRMAFVDGVHGQELIGGRHRGRYGIGCARGMRAYAASDPSPRRRGVLP